VNFQLIFSKKYREVVGMARLTLDLSPEINERLEAIARSNGITKSEAMRRAFALLAVADTEKKKGLSLGIVKETEDHKLEAIGRVVGL
jgi:predicted transcriptional regulator